ncbi:uncharacterized protein LOC116203224 isoform X2 [Punica granatum]|uniref:Uncharacterized protein LOC116203224 isoform X2 n=1 Tax=Punica granatum TaxID=22663 RepID=A0A6P8DB90_PUNGR|nr:uncharacterized protein LOC116203224 isoform X2 [Punica granatum]
MEDQQGSIFGRVRFKRPNELPAYAHGKLQSTLWRGHEYVSTGDMNVLHSPISAMEYLSRSWSPAASNFLQIFSSNNLLLSLDDGCFLGENEEVPSGNQRDEEHEKKSEIEEIKCSNFLCRQFDSGQLEGEPAAKEIKQRKSTKEKDSVTRTDSLQALFTIDRPYNTAYKRRASVHVRWLNLKHIKGWLRGKPLTSLMKGHKEKRKEEHRLHRAKIDAALSVARLAAAVAGITGTNVNELDNFQANRELVHCGNSMGNVVSFAAALVAAVCAEAAETVGASREHVASAVNYGFATQTPADMVTLTATAATCLRGATTLRSRNVANDYCQESKELLASATALPVVTASGHKRHRLVSIHIKDKIVNMMEEARESHAYYLISLQTDGGNIKLFFQNEKQRQIWMSTISNCLEKLDAARANYILRG